MLWGQLAHYEKRRMYQKGWESWLVVDCQDFSLVMNFYKRVVEFTDRQKRTELEKAEWNEAREGRAEVTKEWHKADEEQKRQNTARQLRYKEEKAEWEAAKKKAVVQKSGSEYQP